MESSMRKSYVKSDNYKVVYLLATYRKIFNLNGTDLIADIEKISEKHVDKYFLNLSENGFEELSELEIDIYIKYIAQNLRYECGNFKNALFKEAARTVFEFDDPKKRVELNRALTIAIANITIAMQS